MNTSYLHKLRSGRRLKLPLLLCVVAAAILIPAVLPAQTDSPARERIPFNTAWKFQLGDPADLKSGELDYANLKDFMLATGNDFSKAPPVARPETNPGGNLSFVQAGYDDKGWRQLDLPHDWAIEGPFNLGGSGETGKLPYWGRGWYRKQFALPASDSDRQIFLEIDGAMSYSAVWVNGQLVGGWPYGYSSYALDITRYVKFGEENTVAIRLDNPQNSSRWYPGGGIYRNVWLTKTSPLHIKHWGTYLTTPEISPESATVNLKGTLQNKGSKAAEPTLTTSIYELDSHDQKGATPVATVSTACKVDAAGEGKFETMLKIPNPKLWDTVTPQRYVAVTTVKADGKAVDTYETPFGIRSVRFDAEKGFLLNGKHVALNGVCNHHDLGAIGTAFNTRAAERQLEILKRMGVNALRTSHNMPAPELLDLCDKMGILVMDESFDCWEKAKKPADYHLLFKDWHERDLRAEFRRDRNHPSVIMWSLGNEINEQGSSAAVPIVEELVRIAHEEDPTRPATAGGNGVIHWDPQFAAAYDLLGQNYEPSIYGGLQSKNPGKPIFASETSSCVSSRGEYFFQTPEGMDVFNEDLRKKQEARYANDVKRAQVAGKPTPAPRPYHPIEFSPISKNTHEGGMENFQVSSYDLYAPGWAQTPDEEFAGLDKAPYVAGEFVWTGFDYLGEPTPFNGDLTNLLNFRNDPVKQAELEKQLKEFGKIKCPSRSSYFGIVDLCGFPKDRYYIYQSRWMPDLPMVHILPHWNWPDRVGKVTPVHVYTSGDETELFLNGKSLGRKKKGQFDYRLRWDDVVYEPGELKAVAYRNGKPWAEETVRTTGAAAKLTLEPDRSSISKDGRDLSFVKLAVCDKDGLPVPRSCPTVTFQISGPGEIVATDNGDATDLSTFSDTTRKAYNGLALAIVRAKKGESGPITLKATSNGLTSAETTITAQ